MGYVAVKGGREAIENAFKYYRFLQVKGGSAPLEIEQIRDQLYLAVDRVMGEGSLYAPDLAALALKQSGGDALEAAFMVRAYRTTQPRLCYSLPLETGRMRVIRRISAAFKDIPGGQILGPTPDYTLRLLNFRLAEEDGLAHRKALEQLFKDLPDVEPLPDNFPKIVSILRRDGLLIERDAIRADNDRIFDVTRESISFPADRSAAMQAMAMGETGGLLALAYSNMRGYGLLHPTIGELRVGYVPVEVKNPYTDQPEVIGDIKVTEAEIIYQMDDADGLPKFTLGYGLCFGHNETKAISMAVLDRSTQTREPRAPSEDQEFVLMHTDGVESMGFCNHFKLPHYVTFQSELDRLRRAQEKYEPEGLEG
jgi:alpha-D-ribose 1-methylphosphonate 5-triphosphate synthase subunit PhnI